MRASTPTLAVATFHRSCACQYVKPKIRSDSSGANASAVSIALSACAFSSITWFRRPFITREG
ncbi:MAG: hypothetical protein U0353_30815 [Sandaracinus sp.]